MLEWMRADPVAFFTFMLYRAPAVLLALTLHEVAHGLTADRCGDHTARAMGRLSLNPLRHLSLIGTLMMFTVGMGWAKPVPVNPNNYRHGKRDDFLVSIAGVFTNFLCFLIAALLCILVNELLWRPALFQLSNAYTSRSQLLTFQGVNFSQILYSDSYLITAIRDGQYYGIPMEEFLKTPWLLHVQRFLYQFMLCNLGMCCFNLLPIPPLDGFHVFNDLLLRGRLRLSQRAFQLCMLALLIFMNTSNIVSNLLSKAINGVQGGVMLGFLHLFGLS